MPDKGEYEGDDHPDQNASQQPLTLPVVHHSHPTLRAPVESENAKSE